MTTTPEREPTLTDVLEKLDNLSGKVNELSDEVHELSDEVNELSGEVKKFDERFSNYQQATQWVVQLAFSLIVSATIIVIVTNVLN
jgi:predicted nuclease with TOPRIM domain